MEKQTSPETPAGKFQTRSDGCDLNKRQNRSFSSGRGANEQEKCWRAVLASSKEQPRTCLRERRIADGGISQAARSRLRGTRRQKGEIEKKKTSLADGSNSSTSHASDRSKQREKSCQTNDVRTLLETMDNHRRRLREGGGGGGGGEKNGARSVGRPNIKKGSNSLTDRVATLSAVFSPMARTPKRRKADSENGAFLSRQRGGEKSFQVNLHSKWTTIGRKKPPRSQGLTTGKKEREEGKMVLNRQRELTPSQEIQILRLRQKKRG